MSAIFPAKGSATRSASEPLASSLMCPPRPRALAPLSLAMRTIDLAETEGSLPRAPRSVKAMSYQLDTARDAGRKPFFRRKCDQLFPRFQTAMPGNGAQHLRHQVRDRLHVAQRRVRAAFGRPAGCEKNSNAVLQNPNRSVPIVIVRDDELRN